MLRGLYRRGGNSRMFRGESKEDVESAILTYLENRRT